MFKKNNTETITPYQHSRRSGVQTIHFQVHIRTLYLTIISLFY